MKNLIILSFFLAITGSTQAVASSDCGTTGNPTETMQDICDEYNNTPWGDCLRDISDEFDNEGHDVTPLTQTTTNYDNAMVTGLTTLQACIIAHEGGVGPNH